MHHNSDALGNYAHMENFEELDRLIESCGCQFGNSAWPVYAFRDGKIIIIEAEVAFVAGAWPNPMAWYKAPGKSWRRTWKWANRLIVPNLIPQYCINKACEGEFSAIPYESVNHKADWVGWFLQRQNTLRAYARTFPEDVLSLSLRYSNGQWHMMCFMASCQGAIDLVRSNPALAYCLVSHKLFRQSASGSDPVLEAQSWAYKKQCDILNWLGFAGTDLARRILQNVVPMDVSVVGMRKLRNAMKCKEIANSLSHLPQINKSVLSMISEPALLNRVTQEAFNEIAMQNDYYVADSISYIRKTEGKFNLNPPKPFTNLQDIFSHTSKMGLLNDLEIYGLGADESETDIAKMERLLGCGPHEPFNGIEEMVGYHNHLVSLLKDDSFGFVGLQEVFPAPPFIGTSTIVPIKTLYELLKEKEEMQQYMVDKIYAVARGEEYIYRVVEPVRATLSIRKNYLGFWEFNEMRGMNGAVIDSSSVRYVFAILTNSQPNNYFADHS